MQESEEPKSSKKKKKKLRKAHTLDEAEGCGHTYDYPRAFTPATSPSMGSCDSILDTPGTSIKSCASGRIKHTIEDVEIMLTKR